MPFTQPWFEVNFGSAYAGIGTTGYRLYQASGADSVARTTTGVVDLGNGAYGVAAVNVPDNAVGIEWDTGGGSPVYATEDMEPFRKRTLIKAQTDLLPADPASQAAVLGAIGALNDLSIADVQTALTNQGYTAARALLIDNLDAAITTVLAAIAALNNLSQADVQSALTAQGYTTVRAALIDNLDAAISTVVNAIASQQLDVTFIRGMTAGRWRRDGTQMIFYRSDNVTEIARFDLKKFDGSPATEADVEVAERVRVTTTSTTTTS